MEVEMMRSLVLQFNNDAAANVLPDFTVKDLAGKHTQTILSGMGKLHSSIYGLFPARLAMLKYRT